MKNIYLEILKSTLPQIPGIMRKSEYFNSAVIIPFLTVNGEVHLLFEKRAAAIRQGGEICFPGGQFDDSLDKDFTDTALRETREELGLGNEKVSIIGQMDTLVGVMGVTVDPFIAEIKIDNVDDISFDETEVEKVFTIPLNFFLTHEPEKYFLRMEVHPMESDMEGNSIYTFPAPDLELPERYFTSWQTPKQRVLAYRTPHGTIWGLTAELIHEVVRLLGKE